MPYYSDDLEPDYDDYDSDNYGGYEDCRCSSCRGDDEDTVTEGEEVHPCPRCSDTDRHLDLLSEFYVCRCGASALKEQDPDHPILFTDQPMEHALH